ncbi:hypothetical protein SLE2022_029560 [Rubroshorea leprosula]
MVKLEYLIDSLSNVSEFALKARFDGNSELIAGLVTVNGFRAVYAIKDGAEGARGWMVFANPFSCYFIFHPVVIWYYNAFSSENLLRRITIFAEQWSSLDTTERKH